MQDEAPCGPHGGLPTRATVSLAAQGSGASVSAESQIGIQRVSRQTFLPMDFSPPRSKGSLLEALDELRLLGFGENYEYFQGKLRCVETGAWYETEDVRIIEIRRFEGRSDPDDLAILYVLRMRDGREGVFVDAFGPQADPGAADFMRRVSDLRLGGAAGADHSVGSVGDARPL